MTRRGFAQRAKSRFRPPIPETSRESYPEEAIMEIPKEQILNLIRERMGEGKAQEADQELPQNVDPEQHAGLLEKFGINPQELLSGGLGGIGEKLGF